MPAHNLVCEAQHQNENCIRSHITAREGSGVVVVQNEKLPANKPGVDDGLCLWWRRGRVELPVQEGFRSDIYRLSRR